jgi:hypothetical protein
MNKIVPNIDWYGRYGTASAIADYLEIASIAGIRLTRAEVVDLIDDSGWSRRVTREHYTSIGEDDADEEEARDIADRIFNVFGERQVVLGLGYPFTIDENGRLSFTGDRSHPYVALLAITVAHAANLDIPLDVTQVFEDTVCDILRSRGWKAVNFGRATRDSGFEQGLLAAGVELALQGYPDAQRNMYAQDERVDTIGHYPWCTRSSGRWLVIGQVTCAQSNEWRKKLQEPSPSNWQLRLGEIVEPSVFLAVPHHVENRFRTYLMSDCKRYILDRLSLTLQKQSVSTDEQAIIDSVLGSAVERL